MNTDTVRDLMLMAAEIYSSMVLDLIQRRDRPGGGYHPQPTPGGPSWCTCGRCRQMPTEAEKVCCGKSPDNCVSRTPDFQVVVLDEAVLRVSRVYRQDVLAVGEGDDLAKENRHAGYRQFILWTYGRLGTGVRKAIPSCCVWAIRDRYPDPFGQYIGFVPSRLS
ncbi:hypothetical protein FSP39_022265 [Pinctada imbricata]|uniref:P2X purinoreceptor 7 intracellular domain-containing protein n=1 Tax=Pinctada imbricata TaxID=66713 RepID=A0AA88Y0I3_PINIB|nr:hypothetical protein FSP39_022265 [Pinctada imbricata]